MQLLYLIVKGILYSWTFILINPEKFRSHLPSAQILTGVCVWSLFFLAIQHDVNWHTSQTRYQHSFTISKFQLFSIYCLHNLYSDTSWCVYHRLSHDTSLLCTSQYIMPTIPVILEERQFSQSSLYSFPGSYWMLCLKQQLFSCLALFSPSCQALILAVFHNVHVLAPQFCLWEYFFISQRQIQPVT